MGLLSFAKNLLPSVVGGLFGGGANGNSYGGFDFSNVNFNNVDWSNPFSNLTLPTYGGFDFSNVNFGNNSSNLLPGGGGSSGGGSQPTDLEGLTVTAPGRGGGSSGLNIGDLAPTMLPGFVNFLNNGPSNAGINTPQPTEPLGPWSVLPNVPSAPSDITLTLPGPVSPGGGGGQPPASGGGGAATTGGTGGFDPSSLIQTLTAAGLIGSLTGGNSNDLGPDAAKLRELAGNLNNRGQNLLDTSLANQQGHLDATALNGIERRVRQAEAGIRHSYGEMGMSGSSMEAQDLAGLQERAAQETFDIGQNMAVSGLQTAAQLIGDTSGIYEMLMYSQLQKDQELTRALAEFAAASTRP